MPNRVQKKSKGYSRHYYLGLGFHGFHRINYLEWGNPEKFHSQETLICVHGITRNSRDFDFLAQRLSPDYRVVCPDVVGRGDSDHITTDDGYNYLQYNSDMNALIARLGVTDLSWIGTSMGGIIGMVLASQPQSPIRRLVINDIGPEVEREALLGIASYIGQSGEFRSVDEVEEYLRKIYVEFHPMTDEDWAEMARHSCRRTRSGTYRLKKDSRIGDQFRESISFTNVDMWDAWENVSCPVLVLRGENSNFLTKEIAEKMLTRGPETTLVELADSGHAPTLRSDEQVDVIEDWLKNT